MYRSAHGRGQWLISQLSASDAANTLNLADIIHERCLRARFVIFSSVVKLCLTTRRFLETERLILGHLGKCKTRFSLKK
jgi:hypothetical protein